MLEKPHEIAISLIIPCYRGQEWIAECLRSIRAQTMRRERFEVLVIVNGPVDSSPDIVEQVFRSESDLNYEILYEDSASLSHARNVGIAHARGKWVTWVDVDDWISPNYLDELVQCAASGVVPLAQLVDVVQDSGEHRVSRITDQILEHPPGVVSPKDLWRPLGFAACKLIPTSLARMSKFDVKLRSGEDVAYFAPFMAKHNLKFDNSPAHRGATYYRMLREGSMSRQSPTFDFSVTQRIAVMGHLDEAINANAGDLKGVMRSLINAQALFISRYLNEFPSEYGKVREALQGARLGHTPWRFVTSKTPNLAISYNFPPFADASAMVAAKRIYKSGRHWNVISNDMTGVRARDGGLLEITGPAVSRQKILRAPTAFGSWKSVEEFCARGLEAISELVDESGPQSNIYSRSMWPASHFLAALHKIREPAEVFWTAEFSDPLARDASGAIRTSRDGGEKVRHELGNALRARGVEPPTDGSVFHWAEIVPYVLADSLLFTNVHQLNYMLSYLENADLARTVRRKAKIEPQPVLPAHFYELRPPSRLLDPQKVNIGYFGTFYANRGADVVLSALSKMPSAERKQIRIHIFAPSDNVAIERIRRAGLRRSVAWRDPLPYLDFLALSTKFDALLVADADTLSTGRRLNPYRPSKLSDYIGAKTPLWALYEPGSILSRQDVTYRSRMGDLDGMLDVLRTLTKVKFR